MAEGPVPGPAPLRQPAADPVAVVDAALAPLATLEQLPVADHVAVFDGVHQALQEALATLDRT